MFINTLVGGLGKSGGIKKILSSEKGGSKKNKARMRGDQKLLGTKIQKNSRSARFCVTVFIFQFKTKQSIKKTCRNVIVNQSKIRVKFISVFAKFPDFEGFHSALIYYIKA